jgi:hypothetical protein
VRRAIANLVFDRTIASADHTDLYQHAAFRSAMAEALVRIRSAAGGGAGQPGR